MITKNSSVIRDVIDNKENATMDAVQDSVVTVVECLCVCECEVLGLMVFVLADIAHSSRTPTAPKKIASFLGEEMNKIQYRTGLAAKVGSGEEAWDCHCGQGHWWGSWDRRELDAVHQGNRGRLANEELHWETDGSVH
jgi:hypothetical protein